MIHKNKNTRKIFAMFLTAVITVSATQTIPAADTVSNTPKEEVVYINLNAGGNVKEINVVNIFDLSQEGHIADHGSYQSVRNMTGTEEITYENDVVSINAKAGKLYYEGKLESNEMPWDISIHYYMDGKEFDAEEIAGMSGALKIKMDIAENSSCRGGFFENYALQVSLSLDTKQCSNIIAEDATTANVGSNKQLTFTILPGKGASFEITADVKDFEMDSISINGIPLHLNIEIDDAALMEKVTELSAAIEKLDDGAAELKSGIGVLQNSAQTDLLNGTHNLLDGTDLLHKSAAGLKDGGQTLHQGTSELNHAGSALESGVSSLNSGILEIKDALRMLNQQSPALRSGSAEMKSALATLQSEISAVSVNADDLNALINASSAIKSGIDSLVAGASSLQENAGFVAYKALMTQNGLDIDTLKQTNDATILNLQSTVEALNTQLAAMQGAGMDISALAAQIEQQNALITLLQANNAAIDGTAAYLDILQQNIGALLQGAIELQTNYTAFDTEIIKLVDTLKGLIYQVSELTSAVNTLLNKYTELDSGMNAYTDAVAQIVSGYARISDGASQLVTGSRKLKTGTESLYAGTDQLLTGITELYDGTGTLKDGSGALDEGVQKLLAGIAQLYNGSEAMKEGTAAMRTETAGIDTKIDEQINTLLEAVTGNGAEPESFVSELNSNVKSVQFVIKTASVKQETAEASEAEEPEKLNFWQKLLRLFGLYK